MIFWPYVVDMAEYEKLSHAKRAHTEKSRNCCSLHVCCIYVSWQCTGIAMTQMTLPLALSPLKSHWLCGNWNGSTQFTRPSRQPTTNITYRGFDTGPQLPNCQTQCHFSWLVVSPLRQRSGNLVIAGILQ